MTMHAANGMFFFFGDQAHGCPGSTSRLRSREAGFRGGDANGVDDVCPRTFAVYARKRRHVSPPVFQEPF